MILFEAVEVIDLLEKLLLFLMKILFFVTEVVNDECSVVMSGSFWIK